MEHPHYRERGRPLEAEIRPQEASTLVLPEPGTGVWLLAETEAWTTP